MAEFLMAINLWIFGDAHHIPALQNAALDTLHERITANWIVPTGHIIYVYSHTTPGSALRRYMVNIIGRTGRADPGMKPEHEKLWCSEALFDLVRLVWKDENKRVPQEEAKKWNLCQFHEHEEDVTCQPQSIVIPRPEPFDERNEEAWLMRRESIELRQKLGDRADQIPHFRLTIPWSEKLTSTYKRSLYRERTELRKLKRSADLIS